jgi:protein subunit release factor A
VEIVVARKKILSVSVNDCELQTFRSGGKGGQNQNKRDTGVRLIHHPSGARGESRKERSQLQNKKNAFLLLINSPKFQRWLRVESGIEEEKSCHYFNDDDLIIKDIKVEVKKDGKWVVIDG